MVYPTTSDLLSGQVYMAEITFAILKQIRRCKD